MTEDVIQRAEAWRDHGFGKDPVADLIAALKAARAEIELRDELRENYCPFCAHCEEG